MLRCLQLAKNGLGTTYPNPLVGCVIVHNNKIIGEGWHDKAGNPHAEVNAIKNADTTKLPEATLYVNLEPCSHFGKTPPCANLIIEKRLKTVVIGTTDPHEKVAGKGIEMLQKAGIEVIVGVMEEECKILNKRFFTFHEKQRPYVTLKWAETANGLVAPKSRYKQQPVWITNEFSRQWAHQLRAREQAILVGTNTVLEDNPSLTTRDWSGKNPIRVVLDRNLKIPDDASVLDSQSHTLVLSEKRKKNEGNIVYELMDFSTNIAQQLLDTLFSHSIQSLIIEGGSRTLQSFIDTQLWDEAFVFNGPGVFKEGVPAPKFEGKPIEKTQFGDDLMYHFKNFVK